MPGSWGVCGALIAREFRRLAHDPAALAAIIVAPLVLALITSVSLGARPKLDAKLGVAGMPGGVAALPALDASTRGASFSIVAVSAADAAARVADGTLTAAIVVPADPTTPVQVYGARNEPIAREVATSIARTLTVARGGSKPEPVTLATSPPRREPLEGAEVYGPVIAVFFILFSVGAVSRSIQRQRQDGTLARLLVQPIRPVVVLAAMGVVMFLVGVTEVALMIVATTVLLGAHWGSVLPLALVTIVLVLSAIAIATAISSVTPTPVAAQGLEVAVAMLLVALGGHLVPLRNLPPFVREIARFTPNGASLDAFNNVESGVGNMWSQLAPLVVVVIFTVVVGALALRRLNVVLAP